LVSSLAGLTILMYPLSAFINLPLHLRVLSLQFPNRFLPTLQALT